MPNVTIAGRYGSPIRAVGLEVARILGADYVDHQILANAARHTGAPVEEVAQRDEPAARGRERLARFFQNFLEKSAAAGSAGDPFLGPTGIEVLMSRSMSEAAQPSSTPSERLDDKRYFEAISTVIKEEARSENAVLIGRGSNVILRDWPNTLHVYVVASAETRVLATMKREGLTEEEATKYIQRNEEGRVAYYKKFFKVQPEDPVLYHLFLNADRLGTEHTSRIVVDAVKELSAQPAAV